MHHAVPEDRLTEAVGRIYAAALESSLWPEVIELVSEILVAERAMLALTDFRARAADVVAMHRIDPDSTRLWQEQYLDRDVWGKAMLSYPLGKVASGALDLGREPLLRSDIYHDILHPGDIEDCMGTSLVRGSGRVGYVSFYRGRRLELFDREDVSLLEEIAPHFQRAARLHGRLSTLERERDVGAAALERLPYGILLLDGNGRVCEANRFARSRLIRGDALRSERGRLRATDPAAARALERCVGAALDTARRRGRGGGGHVALPRSGGPPLQALVAPLPRGTTALGLDEASGEPLVLVMLGDPDAAPASPEARLAHLFGLPASEARLAAALLRGRSVREHAEEAGIRETTARAYLKQLLARTGAGRQAELVRRLLPVVTDLPRGDGDA